MTEAKIQAEILRYLRKRGDCFAFKAEVSNERGIPDVICCHKGRFFAFEVKNKKGKPSLLQKAQISRIKKAGGTACVVRGVGEAKELLDEGNP